MPVANSVSGWLASSSRRASLYGQGSTGLFCPGCGTGRALHAIVHGDLAAAVRLNVLAVAAIPVFLALALRAALVPEKPLPRPPLALQLLVYALLAFFLVARNLPFAPFASWAPR